MTTKLVIAVERGTEDPKSCGDCQHQFAYGDSKPGTWQCGAFDGADVVDSQRLAECLAAEHEAEKPQRIREMMEAEWDGVRDGSPLTGISMLLDEEAP